MMGKRTIVVKGTGSVSATPDIFGVIFEVQGHEMNYADSLITLNKRVEDLRQAAESAGIDRKSVKTSSFDISMDRHYNNEKKDYEFNGYIAEHKLKVEFPIDREKSNKLLAAIVDKVSSASFSIYFTVSDPEKLKERMLAEAVKNAKRKADIMADTAGIRLGKILNINYSWSEVRFRDDVACTMAMPDMIHAKAMPDFEPDDIERSDNVEIIWEIEDK
jgi:uncharacterized protein YggE